MDLLVVLVRIALSVIFAVAAVTKLLDQRGTRDAIRNFGAPESLAPALGIILPFAELSIALALLFVASTPAGSLAAILILVLFVAGVSVSLARGHTHDCHCFGQLYSRPLGWPTLIRNVVFVLGAVLVFWHSLTRTTLSIAATVSEFGWLGWAALAVAGAVVVAVLVYAGRRKPRAAAAEEPQKGLPIDAEAPAFEAAAYTGGRTSLAELLAYGKPLLLIFTNPKCGPCVALFEEIKVWQQSHQDAVTIALISMGTIKENFVNVARNGLGQVLLQKEREVAQLYGARLTPTAVVVSRTGKIASPLAAGADDIRKLLSTVLGNSKNHSTPDTNAV